jgi:lauroyl/myristoyl acyltransferase
MRFQEWIEGRWAIKVGLWIGQHTSRRFGYAFARTIADGIVSLRPEVYWRVRDNLRHVLGPDLDPAALHAAVRQVFVHAGETYYDFFHAIGQPRRSLARAVHISPSLLALLQSERDAGRGVVLYGVHMSNFDLGILALGAHGLSAQLLSLGGRHDGFALLNDLRERHGLEVTVIGPQALRQAVRRLRAGGLVMTGADRPVPGDGDDLVPFFGRAARLPLGPARLALLTDATVLLGACHRDPGADYVLDVTGPIEMVRTGDRTADILASARRLAEVMEVYVRARPVQWMMFHRLWPD